MKPVYSTELPNNSIALVYDLDSENSMPDLYIPEEIADSENTSDERLTLMVAIIVRMSEDPNWVRELMDWFMDHPLIKEKQDD